MTRKTVLSIAFLSITGVAVGMEVWFAVDHDSATVPWTNLLATYVPAPITFAAIALLLSWLPGHMIEAYARRGKHMVTTTTIPATPDPGAAKEPLITPTIVVAAFAALADMLVAYGVPMTEKQMITTLAFISVVSAIALTLWSRRKAFAPATVRAMVVEAAASGQVKTEATVVPAESQGLSEPRNPGTGERLA
jgi:hypothetical protein